jgi:hypothetical protein
MTFTVASHRSGADADGKSPGPRPAPH